MPLCMVVTRDVEQRYRGFLGSIMLEVAPGVYVAPNLTKGIRDRMLTVLRKWHETLQRGSVTVVWKDASAPGGLAVVTLGDEPKELYEHEGLLLARRCAGSL